MSIETTRWRIDPSRSSVEFRVRTIWGLATVKGRFAEYQGTLGLGADPAIELTVDSASVDTENKRRDEHLRSPDFLAAEEHPYLRFVSQAAELDGERLTIHGRLRARGEELPLVIDATLRPVGDELVIAAVTEADHRRLGITWNMLGLVSTPSQLLLNGRLVREPLAG
jgi:polyisoprenoid-binding protein YceI